MKMILTLAALLACAPLHAQQLPAPAAPPSLTVASPSGDMTLGGVPKLIAQKLEEAKPAGMVDFAGHIGGGAYVPTYTFHDVAGINYAEVADIGYRALQNAKPAVYLMPLALNLTALSGRVLNFQWAHDHVTRSAYPDIFVGLGPLLPLDHAQLSALKLNQPKDWLAGSASCRFN